MNNNAEHSSRISALVLAAGISQRMGRPKMVLPWGETSILGRVVQVLSEAGLIEIVIVTGGAREQVEIMLSSLKTNNHIRTVYNPNFANGEMLHSIQVGLGAMDERVEAAMISLGDQPQIQATIVRQVLNEVIKTQAPIIVPSYQMRRGHPWIIRRVLWPEILSLHPPSTLRDFMRSHQQDIHYLNVDRDSILQDIDTPEEYQAQKPK